MRKMRKKHLFIRRYDQNLKNSLQNSDIFLGSAAGPSREDTSPKVSKSAKVQVHRYRTANAAPRKVVVERHAKCTSADVAGQKSLPAGFSLVASGRVGVCVHGPPAIEPARR